MIAISVLFDCGQEMEINNIKDKSVIDFFEWYASDEEKCFSLINHESNALTVLNKEKITRIEIHMDKGENLREIFKNVRWENGKISLL
jgi:hypothetical protein